MHAIGYGAKTDLEGCWSDFWHFCTQHTSQGSFAAVRCPQSAGNGHYAFSSTARLSNGRHLEKLGLDLEPSTVVSFAPRSMSTQARQTVDPGANVSNVPVMSMASRARQASNSRSRGELYERCRLRRLGRRVGVGIGLGCQLAGMGQLCPVAGSGGGSAVASGAKAPARLRLARDHSASLRAFGLA